MCERQHTHHAHYAGSLARPFHNEQVIFKRALGQGPGPLRKGPLGPKIKRTLVGCNLRRRARWLCEVAGVPGTWVPFGFAPCEGTAPQKTCLLWRVLCDDVL